MVNNSNLDGHNNIISYGVLYFTDSILDEKIATWCQTQLLSAIGDKVLVSVSLKPLDFGRNIVMPGPRGYKSMFEQILAGLEALDTDVVFMAEHDVGYPPSHFDFTPSEKDKFYYDLNWWKIRKDGLAVHWDAAQVSGLCYYRELGIKFYKERLATFDPDKFDRKFEPTVGIEYETWWADYPSIDIRHDHNLTYNKWKLDHFRKKDTAVNFQASTIDKIPGWSNLRDLLE